MLPAIREAINDEAQDGRRLKRGGHVLVTASNGDLQPRGRADIATELAEVLDSSPQRQSRWKCLIANLTRGKLDQPELVAQRDQRVWTVQQGQRQLYSPEDARNRASRALDGDGNRTHRPRPGHSFGRTHRDLQSMKTKPVAPNGKRAARPQPSLFTCTFS
jgi:hypothetical protein